MRTFRVLGSSSALVLFSAASFANAQGVAGIAKSGVPPDIVIPKVESKYRLPPASEESRFRLDRRKAELEKHRGDASPRLRPESASRTRSGTSWPANRSNVVRPPPSLGAVKPMASHLDVFEEAKKAIDAGCDDPLVLYVWAWASSGRNQPLDPREWYERSIVAAEAMRDSPYSAFRRSAALALAAQRLVPNAISSAAATRGGV